MRARMSAAVIPALLLAGPMGAQQTEVARYGLEQGLPQSMVNHVVQDSLGFLWFGTGYGLARFDGVRWAEFKHDAYDTTTISNDAIWGIAALPYGDLLVGTAVGLDRYHARTGHFDRLRTGVAPDGCWRPVYADARRVLLYSPLSASFLVVDAQGGTRAIPSGHGPSYAMRASPDGMRVRYHVSPDTLVDHDLATGQRTYARLPAAVRGGLRDLLPVDSGLLVLTDRGAWTVDDAGGCTPLPGEAGALLRDAAGNKLVQRAPGGRLWVAMDGEGVIELDDRWGVRAHYPLLPPDERPLLLTSLSFDRQGNVWAGTDGKGVFRIAPQRIKFGRAMPGVLQGWSPPSWFVRGFAQWDGTRVLVAFHQGGAALFDERDGQLRPLDLARDLGLAPSDRTIDRSLNDAHGNIWLKCGPQVVVLAPGGRRAIHRSSVPAGAFLVNDAQGRVVLAQVTGIHRAVAGDDAVRWEALAFPGLAEALVDQVGRLAMDPDGQLWSSHLHAGLRLWTVHGERPLGRGWDGPEGTRFKLSAVVPAANGGAWMATDRGLLEVDPRTGDLRGHLNRRHGLPDDHIYGVVVDDAGTCWGSTNKGLFRMQGGQVRNYTAADGLQSKEFNGHAWFRSASGRIYFGGTNGFNHFMPGAVRDDPDPPMVRIVRLGDDAGPIAPPVGDAPLRLPWPRNALNAEVAVLEFTAPERNTYRWRMRGHRDAWSTAAASVPIAMENVPAGTYLLEVEGINGDGTPGGVQAALRIAVVRPFWARPGTMVTATAAVIALAAWAWSRGVRRRLRARLAESEREMRELRLRTRLARDIHDDVGSGLARMAALARSPKRLADSDARFEKLGAISSELLDNLRDVVWLNDPRQGSLDALLLHVRDHAQDLFEGTGARVCCTFPDPLPTRTIGGLFRRNLFLIAKEALHNVRKHADARRIMLHWEHDGERFAFMVSDDGRGMGPGAAHGAGHGTGNMGQRAADMGAVFEVTGPPQGGTSVRVHGRTSCLDE